MNGEPTAPDTDRSARRERRRAELVDAAVAAIRHHGAGATMEQLASSGGVTKPILYRHFGDREGLLRAIGFRFAAELLDEVQSSLAGEGDPRVLLQSTVDAYLAFVERDPHLYRFLVQEGRGQPASLRAHDPNSLVDEVAARVATVIRQQLRAAGLDPSPAEPWAYGIVGMVHLSGDWWLEHQTMSRQQLTDHLTRLLWDGFAGQAPAGAARRATSAGDDG